MMPALLWLPKRTSNVRRRAGIVVPIPNNRKTASVIIPLEHKYDRQEVESLIEGQLSKLGLSNDEARAAREAAEVQRDYRMKVWEASQELRRLMDLRALGVKLMQRGFRKWAPVFYRPVTPRKPD